MGIDFSDFLYITLSCTVGDMTFCGIFDAGFFEKGNLTYEVHNHLQYELHIALGEDYTLENLDCSSQQSLKTDMISLIPPGYYHNCRTNTEDGVYRYTMRLEIGKAEEIKSQAGLYDEFVQILMQSKETIFSFLLPGATEILEYICHELLSEDIINLAMAEAYFKLFMTHLVRAIVKTKTSVRKNKMVTGLKDDTDVARKEKIDAFFNNGYDNPGLNATMLAQSLNLSLSQTKRIVYRYYGVPFKQLLIDVRLTHAKKMLLHTDLSIENISAQVGYRTASNFFAAFKNKQGMTPNAFRLQNKNT